MRIFFIVYIVISFSFPRPCAQVKQGSPFNIDFPRESIIIAIGAVSSVAAFSILEKIKPLTIEEINSLSVQDVNSFDRAAIGPLTSDHLGNILLYTSYLLPVSFIAYEQTRNDLLDLTMLYSEVLLIQASINGIIRGTVQRTRPFVYDADTPVEEKTTIDAKISFFSGHTSMAAAISFFTARVLTAYIEDDAAITLIWSGAILFPAATALSRVNTHWHFPTDVITGYAVGALIGYLIPEIHKVKKNGNVSVYPSLNFGRPAISLHLNF